MQKRRSLWWSSRRVAAGIDVSRQAVRVAVVSRRGRRGRVRVDALGGEVLPSGACDATGDVDWTVVSRVLADLTACASTAIQVRPLRGVMALPAGAFATASLAWPPAASRGAGERIPGVALSAAEQATGLARDTLAVDWCVRDDGDAPELSVSAAAQAHVDARVDAAAAAGIALSAVDGEPPAALRAIRHVAALKAGEREPYLAVWVGDDGVFGWLVADGVVVSELRYPSLEHADLADALRALAREGAPRCAFVAGDLESLGGTRITLADLGDLLGCVALPFECAGFCDPASPPAGARDPRYALAFGLALRGVLE